MISKADSKKTRSCSSNYQDSAVMPVEHQFDDEAVQLEEEDGDDDESAVTERHDGI